VTWTSWRERRRFRREHAFATPYLSHLLDGDLDAADGRRIGEHVSRCAECRRVLRTLRRSVESLLGMGVDAPPDIADRVIARLRSEG
jgi:predicted anti-sigma-YlaC factor YlaD